MTVGFVWLRGLNDGRFLVAVLLLCSFHEISKTVGFDSLRDFNDDRFCWVIGFQCQSVYFHSKISMTVDFFSLRDFNDGWFRLVTRTQ